MTGAAATYLLTKSAALAARGKRYLARRTPAHRAIGRQRALYYEHLWTAAAADLHACVEKAPSSALDISGSRRTTRVRLQETQLDDAATLQLAGDKAAVHQLLATGGIPVPKHCIFDLHSVDKARHFLQSNSVPCVVKPAKDTGGGCGVTAGLQTPRQLRRAVGLAAAACPVLLIEEQSFGTNYRLLFLDGVLLDATARLPPTLCGDGRSTLRQLVQRENARRLAEGYLAAQSLLNIDLDMHCTLANQGLTLRSIIPAATNICVKTAISENGSHENIPAVLCDDIVATAAKAARLVGARLAGVDVITTLPDRPLEDGGVVLEVNTTPSLYYHSIIDGQLRHDVASRVLRRLLEHDVSDADGTLTNKQLVSQSAEPACSAG